MLGECLTHRVFVLIRNDVDERVSDDLGRRVPEQLDETGIDVGKSAVDCDDEDSRDLLFDQTAELSGILTDRVLRSFMCGDVPKEPDATDIPSIVQPDRRRVAIQSPTVFERDLIAVGSVDICIQLFDLSDEGFPISDLCCDGFQQP